MRKSIVVIFNQFNIKNNKIDENNFEKHHNKKKIILGNTITIHNVLKKKTTKLNFQPAQYEKNKLDKHNSGQKTKTIIKKNHVENIVAIHNVLKKKKLQS
jgi:hypothetical protein